MPRHNNIALGPDSPLLTPAQAKRRLQPKERDIQKAAMTLLVGPARKGEPRRLGDGMTGKHPELMLLTAINPNAGGQQSVAARGMAKAMGMRGDVPDLHLPVARYPFHSLYIEVKVPGKKPTAEQVAFHQHLRDEDNCVVTAWSVEAIVFVVVAYLRLDPSWLHRESFDHGGYRRSALAALRRAIGDAGRVQ